MNRKVIVGAFAIISGTFAIGVGCGGSTSDTLPGSTGAGTGGSSAAGSGGTSSSVGGAQGVGGNGTGGVGTGGKAAGTGGNGAGGKGSGGTPGAGGAGTGGKGGGPGAGGNGTGGNGTGGNGTGGKATGGNGTGGNGTGGVAAGGNGTGGNGTGGIAGTNGTGGNGTAGSITIFDASVDVDPDTSIGNDATVGTCYECVGAKCQKQLDSCGKDPKCEMATTCVLSTCSGTMDIQCVLGCGQAAGITNPQDPAATEIFGVAQCAQQNCSADCGAGQMTMGMGPGGPGAGGGTGTGGNGTAGGGGATQGCSFMKCGQQCPAVTKCFQDNGCQKCLQNPQGAGCDTNANFQAVGQCCTANADVCGSCMFCP